MPEYRGVNSEEDKWFRGKEKAAMRPFPRAAIFVPLKKMGEILTVYQVVTKAGVEFFL